MDENKVLMTVREDGDSYQFDIEASLGEMLLIIQALAAKAAEIIEETEVH